MYEIDHGGEFKAYRGPDRRKNGERRVSNDRREMIRFEPDKAERRRGGRSRRAPDVRDAWDRQYSNTRAHGVGFTTPAPLFNASR
jgi:hypothetical protein